MFSELKRFLRVIGSITLQEEYKSPFSVSQILSSNGEIRQFGDIKLYICHDK